MKPLFPPVLIQRSSWILVGSSSTRQRQVQLSTACFYVEGSFPSRSEALIIAVMYSSRTSTISFNKNVGMGPSAHDFVGDCTMNWRTSSSLHGDSSDIDMSVVDEVYAGSCWPSVDAQTAEEVGPFLCSTLPAMHAISGCDSTSGLFKIGKRTAYKTLQRYQDELKGLTEFQIPDQDTIIPGWILQGNSVSWCRKVARIDFAALWMNWGSSNHQQLTNQLHHSLQQRMLFINMMASKISNNDLVQQSHCKTCSRESL